MAIKKCLYNLSLSLILALLIIGCSSQRALKKSLALGFRPGYEATFSNTPDQSVSSAGTRTRKLDMLELLRINNVTADSLKLKLMEDGNLHVIYKDKHGNKEVIFYGEYENGGYNVEFEGTVIGNTPFFSKRHIDMVTMYLSSAQSLVVYSYFEKSNNVLGVQNGGSFSSEHTYLKKQ